jgi:hypothetical protein
VNKQTTLISEFYKTRLNFNKKIDSMKSSERVRFVNDGAKKAANEYGFAIYADANDFKRGMTIDMH